MFNEENIKKITGLEYQYEYEKEKQAIELKQQKKDAVLAEEAKRQKIVRNSFITGFILMFMLVLYVLRSFLQKHKANRILAAQKNEIEGQNTELLYKNEEIQKINNELNKQKQKIIDSINYAKKIQSAMLPSEKLFKNLFSDYFIFYQPKDIVSGDFYWLTKIRNYIIIASLDCTGHGIPGTFMSVLGTALLNETMRKKEISQPNQVLNKMRKYVKILLHQTGNYNESEDGMDMSLCIIDTVTNKMQYACANNPAYIIRKRNSYNKPEIIELTGDPMPIGIYINEFPFNNYEIKLTQNDRIYLFTDGYIDQFGGTKNDKFMNSRFNELLLSIYDQPMIEQKTVVEETFNTWKRHHSQVDDVLVMGIKI